MEAMLRIFNDPKLNLSEKARKNLIQSMFDSQHSIYGFFDKAKDLKMLYKAEDLKTYFEGFLNNKRFGQKEIMDFLRIHIDLALS